MGDNVLESFNNKIPSDVISASLLQNGGANTSSSTRSGVFVSYSLGWVRQEHNHYLTIPREVADSNPDQIRRLIGYQSHGPYLGIYPGDPDGNWWDA